MIQKELLLQAKNVSKYFYEPEKFKVLNNISFDIHKGEFVTMVGKSGSGKSTLLYLLSTMDTDYEGNIFFDSENLTHKTKEELAAIRNEKIGFVFQFHYLLPEFSSLKNVMIPALKLGKYSKPEIEERAYSILTKLDLKDQALKPANKLSGGQQQRVAIARALINDPKIIMGDEPTGNLDSKNAAIVFDLFKQLTTQFDQTVLAVTHDNDFAKASDRIIEMAAGIIL
ncbi:ABC transporter ATP-binding protein [Flavobacterium psychrophilum]|uniref:ABC transporter ATP-binding protein n=1 Tax=Flavobacterium psychrophilum TaxID=96345 RepID=UPI00106D052F|nr:ABC transporter ATP-binding protein [Flavobacterium psychrophilum]